MSQNSRRCQFTLKVQPSASRDEVVGLVDGVVRVRVCAPPVKGKANAAVVALLARALGVGRGDIAIIRGATARTKVMAIEGLGIDEALARLVPQAPIDRV